MTPGTWTQASRCETAACLQARWTRATRCDTATCVETRTAYGAVQVRDSKNPDGPVLTFTPAEWTAFVAGAKAGEFDL